MKTENPRNTALQRRGLLRRSFAGAASFPRFGDLSIPSSSMRVRAGPDVFGLSYSVWVCFTQERRKQRRQQSIASIVSKLTRPKEKDNRPGGVIRRRVTVLGCLQIVRQDFDVHQSVLKFRGHAGGSCFGKLLQEEISDLLSPRSWFVPWALHGSIVFLRSV